MRPGLSSASIAPAFRRNLAGLSLALLVVLLIVADRSGSWTTSATTWCPRCRPSCACRF